MVDGRWWAIDDDAVNNFNSFFCREFSESETANKERLQIVTDNENYNNDYDNHDIDDMYDDDYNGDYDDGGDGFSKIDKGSLTVIEFLEIENSNADVREINNRRNNSKIQQQQQHKGTSKQQAQFRALVALPTSSYLLFRFTVSATFTLVEITTTE